MDLVYRLAAWWETLKAREEGQGLTEYALILALVSIGTMAAMILLRNEIADVFQSVCKAMNNNAACT